MHTHKLVYLLTGSLFEKCTESDIPPAGVIIMDANNCMVLKEYLRRYGHQPTSVVYILYKLVLELSILHDVGLTHGNIATNRVFVVNPEIKVYIYYIRTENIEDFKMHSSLGH